MRSKTLLFAFLLMAAATRSGMAYTYRYTDEGKIQKWSSMPISYTINQYGSEDIPEYSWVEDAFKSSFQVWDQISLADITFSYQEKTTSGTVSGQDRINLLAFDSYTSNLIVTDVYGPSVVGIAISSFYPSTGEIVDCDIIFNDQEYTFTTSGVTDMSQKTVNLKDVATHEIGHMLGLDHTFIEDGTMWPYARGGQQSLMEDDIAGVSTLYPGAAFAANTEAFSGKVSDEDGNILWGIYVSAIRQDTGEESIAAISGSGGSYTIEGLDRATGYYLKARSVDLNRLGSYMQAYGTYDPFIPQYYSDATRLEDAQVVISGNVSEDLDFQLNEATILASYDTEIGYTVVSSLQDPEVNQDYLAVRFPASSLPQNFKIASMTFYNNDDDMSWPRIMLTTGSGDQPDMDNILRLAENYVGNELGLSAVEWEMYQSSNARDLWVVFQLPGASNVGLGVGPALIAETGGIKHQNFFHSTDGGNTFLPYNSNFDPVVYLTVGLIDAPLLEPKIEVAVKELDFGFAKVGVATQLPLPVENQGSAALELTQILSSKMFFSVSGTQMTIPAGSADTLSVSFTPPVANSYTGTISMATNDPAMGTVNLSVKGSGVYSAASIGVEPIDFGEAEQGQTIADRVVISNIGSVSLLVSQVSASPEDFSAQPTQVEIAAGDSSALEVTFSPIGEGPVSGSLTFTTDDPDNDQVTIDLSGTGLAGEPPVFCDFNSDGSINIVDVISLLLFQREHPGDPRGDFNGDGSADITDVISMLLAQRDGTCPDASAALLSADAMNYSEPLANTLSSDQIAYIEKAFQLLNLTSEEEAAAKLVIYGAGNSSSLPKAFALVQNYPNPFNPSTVIAYSVPQHAESKHVTIKVYDIRGALVRVLVDNVVEPGNHATYWDGTNSTGHHAPSGVYLYRLQAGSEVITRKMVILN
jgi:Matrixin/HYDIN/CFA65/VesB-like, Ig-like domain/FlgD Ig-like domain